MSILIFCAGMPVNKAAGKYNSSGFDAAIQEELRSAADFTAGKKLDPAGRTVLVGEGVPAGDTAEKLLLPCPYTVEPLLNEIPLRSFTDTDVQYSLDTWLRKAAAQRKKGDARQPESRTAVIERAETLIGKIEGSNPILVSYPLFLTELLDRLRVHGYVIQRSGVLKIQPLERFVVSHRDEHCDGCQHNCFLDNPGCGIGRDKAMRQKQSGKAKP